MNILKKYVKILIIICILFCSISNCTYLYAVTSSELNSKQNELDSKIDGIKSEIAGTKEKMTAALNQIDKLNAEITTYKGEINQLQGRINEVEAQIKIKEDDLTVQEEKYKTQKELLDKRLIALYESGSTSYLDMLLSCENLSDLISKYYLIEELAEADEELLDRIANTQEKIKAEKDYLVNAKSEIEENKKSLKAKENSLASSVSQKQSLVSNLTEEEKELQEQLEEFEEDKRIIQAELAKIAAEEAKKNNNQTVTAPSACGYIFPVLGCTRANINNPNYPSYATHTGIDININVKGKNVIAVKDGTVVTSTAMRNSKGQYKSYGEYIVINHHDGTMTLYAHMLSGSRTVSPGDKVTQGQVIGKVGSTGKSSGDHLHFEVRVKGSCVNPTPYLP